MNYKVCTVYGRVNALKTFSNFVKYKKRIKREYRRMLYRNWFLGLMRDPRYKPGISHA